jgi:hypothetical protein
MPLRSQTSGGTVGERVAAARMTRAMTRVAERDTPHWQLVGVSGGVWGEGHILDEDALVALEGGVDKGHGGGEAVCDEIALAVGPGELEIVHGGTAGGGVRGVVGGGGAGRGEGERGGCEGAEGLGVGGVDGGGDLLGDVEDGRDAAGAEGVPVAGVVLGAEPDAGQDLDGAGGVGHGGRPVLVRSRGEGTDGGEREVLHVPWPGWDEARAIRVWRCTRVWRCCQRVSAYSHDRPPRLPRLLLPPCIHRAPPQRPIRPLPPHPHRPRHPPAPRHAPRHRIHPVHRSGARRRQQRLHLRQVCQ